MTAGILRGIEDGWFMSEIADAAFAYQRALEKGDKKIVGVNATPGTVEEHAGDPAGLARGRARAGRACSPRAGPPATTPRSTRPLAAHGRRRPPDDNLVPPMLDAARAEATLGEICGALREEWGGYTEPARF